MRVLHVNKFLYRRGGAEAYMEDAAALFAEAGHEVAFFGMEHPENTHREFAEHLVPAMDFDPPPPSLLGKARAAGRMFWSTSARRGIDAVLADFRPDVVHVHNIYHQISPSVLRPLASLRIPTVMTLHDYKLVCPTYLFLDKGKICESCLGGKFWNAPRKRCNDGSLLGSALPALELFVHTKTRAYDPVHLFICPSRFIAGKMEAGNVYPERLRVLHNFVDPAGVPTKQTPGGPVVYASRLSSEKGVDVLVSAMGHVGPEHRLVVAGDGPERGALEALAASVAPGRVDFLGRLPKSSVSDLLATAGVVAAPSRCYENQPLSVLEAFAAKVPVVGSSLGGIAELVSPGVTGEVVPPNDPAALGAALQRVLDDPVRALAMGAAGRDLIDAEYSKAGHLHGLETLYAEAALAAGRVLPRAQVAEATP